MAKKTTSTADALVSSDRKTALRDRIMKTSTIKEAAILSESVIFNNRDLIKTSVPIINVALGGDFNGGLRPGLLMIAGPSKHFKTGFGLLAIHAFLQKYPDGIILFYDSEFGSPASYFASYGIPADNVIHIPITDVEMLKTDVVTQLRSLGRDDKVMIFVDSVGNLASVKEIADTLKGEGDKADFTRAKALKSFFRMIVPHLVIKDIPMVAINHSYQTIEMYSKTQVSGGTGGIYGADDIWIIGRQQDKSEKEGLLGYNFTVRLEKSRSCREGSKFNVSISFKDGIDAFSGLWELAQDYGFIKPSRIPGKIQGYVLLGDSEEPVLKDALVHSKNFYDSLVNDKGFNDWVREKYALEHKDGDFINQGDVIDLETGEVLEDEE